MKRYKSDIGQLAGNPKGDASLEDNALSVMTLDLDSSYQSKQQRFKYGEGKLAPAWLTLEKP